MPRFVVLRHDHPSLHWDLMLDAGETLWTWRLAGPLRAGTQPAERIADHRRHYLDYEGPVSGGRGTVSRERAGEFRWVEGEGVVVAIDGGRLTLTADAAHLEPTAESP